MRTLADSTLMSMRKTDLIECLRCAEHNQAVAEETLAQHIENVKDWVPVVLCRDCKYSDYNNKNEMYCYHCFGLEYIEPDYFCSYGEREEQTHGES